MFEKVQMSLHIDLLQFYKCKTFADLLERTSDAFMAIGFPHLVLKWTPSAGAPAKMLNNTSIIWSNFANTFGSNATGVSDVLRESIAVALVQARDNTIECQNWRLAMSDTYRLRRDAPKPFFLTRYQRSIIRDFGEAAWTEFIAFPLVKERERVLVLEAKTQEQVSEHETELAGLIFSVFDCVYQCLHRPFRVPSAEMSNGGLGPVLSRRELQCLRWLSAGKTFSEAATILDISERTLRFHVGNAKTRLGVSTTMQAVVAAAMLYGFDPNDPRGSLYAVSREPESDQLLKTKLMLG